MLAVDREPIDPVIPAGRDAASVHEHDDETPAASSPSRVGRAWHATWPKVAAIVLAVAIWQVVVWTGWRPEFVLPSPFTVFKRLGELIADGTVGDAVVVTMRRALIGYAIALVVGVVIGGVIVSSAIARSAVGSMITGLQTMPSIAWFPLAIVLFKLSEGAITFVVVIGAAPSIANGLISGVDHVPPILRRAGRAMGAGRWATFRHVVLPAAVPSFIGGLKQGWSFAWRSLMAGELLVTLGVFSVGFLLSQYRSVSDYPAMIAIMIVILVIGIVIDGVLFAALDRWVRRRHGLSAD
ncbi:MAG: ABC transporter permease [Ilumatobacteraceae bacterium]